jgi:hypothetical protein
VHLSSLRPGPDEGDTDSEPSSAESVPGLAMFPPVFRFGG